MSDSPSDIPDDPVSGGVGSLLSTLRTLPVWMLAGLALAGYAVLFLPAFGGVDLKGFRFQWGIWAWIASVTFSILALARGLDAVIDAHREHRKKLQAGRALRLVPRHHQSWWHLAKQQDHSLISQITVDIEAANLTDQPVRIVKASLLRPRSKGGLVQSDVLLPMAGSPYHDSRHPVPPHDTVTASVHLIVRGTLAAQGHPLRVTLGITDQFGDDYQLKGIVLRATQSMLPKLPWSQRLVSFFRNLPGLNPGTTSEFEDEEQLPKEWDRGGTSDEVDLILNEERRAYAACGRLTGGLGSLNVGLQSGSSLGSPLPGNIPRLLCDEAHATRVDSPNLVTMIKLRDSLESSGRDDLERYLLSHLDRRSPYADVAYFTFLALHRMGRTVDALTRARSRLAGDKVYGYSNLLGALAAVVSREHSAIDPVLYPKIQKVLEGDTEHDFGLAAKINRARLEHLDSELGAK